MTGKWWWGRKLAKSPCDRSEYCETEQYVYHKYLILFPCDPPTTASVACLDSLYPSHWRLQRRSAIEIVRDSDISKMNDVHPSVQSSKQHREVLGVCGHLGFMFGMQAYRVTVVDTRARTKSRMIKKLVVMRDIYVGLVQWK
jgi:hypothetical protein